MVAVPFDTKVILQMPRGNLEAIHPRPLALAAVKKMLGRSDFKGAILMMKRHRIDMNLLYDHDPAVKNYFFGIWPILVSIFKIFLFFKFDFKNFEL